MAYPTDVCWETGVFTDDCECEFCSHKEECSGYTGDAFEEDDEQARTRIAVCDSLITYVLFSYRTPIRQI